MIKNILKLLSIAKEYKLWMLLAGFMGFLTIGSSIGLMMTSAYIIAKAALHPSIAELQIGVVGVRLFGISRGVFRYLERYISHEVTFSILAKFRVWFFNSIEPLVPSRISKYKSGSLLNNAVSDVESLEHFYVRVIAPPIVAFMVLILFTLLFGMYSFYYSFIVSSFFLLGGIGVSALTFYLSKNIGANLVTLQTRLTELSIDQTQGMAELLVFGQQDKYLKEFNNVNSEYTSLQRKMALISGLHESLIGLLMNFAVVVILIVAIPNVTSGILEGVYLSVLTLGTMAVFEAVFPLPTALQYLEKTSKSAEAIFSIADEKSIIIYNTIKENELENFDIRINSLNFSYDKNQNIYNNLNIVIPQNKLTAIVGVSGAGKSTLINLLMRFWDYKSGEILIGEKDIKNFSQNDIQKYISVVPQSTHLFNLSIKENIKFANPDATNKDIVEAAKLAFVYDFIDSLPNKYNDLIGEQGLKLSGGERQRISIARSILKDTPIMVFDEPTSDLDAITEQNIIDTIYKLGKTKTVLVITHRLVHLENFDNILVMDKGKIVEQGSHSHLINQNGLYKNLLNSQNNHI